MNQRQWSPATAANVSQSPILTLRLFCLVNQRLKVSRFQAETAFKSFQFMGGRVHFRCLKRKESLPGSTIASWRELMAAAVVVRSMLGVSPSAYQAACDTMGPENAATVMACILERANHINSAGGYLRTLTERAKEGEFGLGPMLMALIKANQGQVRKAG
jgi:hypothetical protein